MFTVVLFKVAKSVVYAQIGILNGNKKGTPGWLSGCASAFGSGRDPGVLGSSPTLGSLHGACFSLCLCLCLSLSLSASHE